MNNQLESRTTTDQNAKAVQAFPNPKEKKKISQGSVSYNLWAITVAIKQKS
jgi:hypothetical protein